MALLRAQTRCHCQAQHYGQSSEYVYTVLHFKKPQAYMKRSHDTTNQMVISHTRRKVIRRCRQWYAWSSCGYRDGYIYLARQVFLLHLVCCQGCQAHNDGNLGHLDCTTQHLQQGTYCHCQYKINLMHSNLSRSQIGVRSLLAAIW